jgi:hypothetical protein
MFWSGLLRFTVAPLTALMVLNSKLPALPRPLPLEPSVPPPEPLTEPNVAELLILG